MPEPVLDSTSPLASSERIASRTTVLLTPSILAISPSAGRRSPRWSFWLTIRSSNCCFVLSVKLRSRATVLNMVFNTFHLEAGRLGPQPRNFNDPHICLTAPLGRIHNKAYPRLCNGLHGALSGGSIQNPE